MTWGFGLRVITCSSLLFIEVISARVDQSSQLQGFFLRVDLPDLVSFFPEWSVPELTTIGPTYPHPTTTMHFLDMMALIHFETSGVSILCVLWGLLILSFHLVLFDDHNRS
jgi:hypothetical protein